MEVIADINDLACDSIESGDYQTALDVLNCCLGCVKQLKKCRATMTEDRSRDRHSHYSNSDHNKATRENVSMLLKGAKRRLVNRNRHRNRKRSMTTAFKTTADAPLTVATAGNKRKVGVVAPPPTSNADAISTSTSMIAAIDGRTSRKKRRRNAPDDGDVVVDAVNPSPETETECSTISVVPGYPVSGTTDMTSPNNDNSVRKQQNPPNQYHQEQQKPHCCPYNEAAEDRYFIYRKPLRLTKFQWSRIAECQCTNKLLEAGVVERNNSNNCQSHIDREVELAVSSNLIFNIALSHHLIASTISKGSTTTTTTKQQEALQDKQGPRRSGSSDNDTDDDDESGCGYDSSGSDDSSATADSDSSGHTNTLQTNQRLKGALRLYELGFRVHTKRVAYVASASAAPQPRVPASFYPSSLATTTATATSVSRPTTAVGAAPWEQQQTHNTHTSTTTTTTDRDDELRSTTRFALALLNNCAHIHEALGQTEKALVFQKRLLSFLLVIVDSGESIHEIIGDDPAVDGYLKNVIAGTVFDKDTASAAVA